MNRIINRKGIVWPFLHHGAAKVLFICKCHNGEERQLYLGEGGVGGNRKYGK